MKNYKALILSGALLVFANNIGAQIIYTTTDGMTQGQVMMNIYADNARAAAAQAGMTGAMSANMIAAAKARIEQAGAAKIKAGKATTNFTATRAGREALVKSLTFGAGKPQTLEGQVALVQKYVNWFNKLAAQNGVEVNDYADGTAFAHALSYAAYNNKDLDNRTFEQMRKGFRQQLLNDNFFQGDTDAAKQYTYEIHAQFAMQAAEQRAKARRATSDAERNDFEEKAKRYASFVLNKEQE